MVFSFGHCDSSSCCPFLFALCFVNFTISLSLSVLCCLPSRSIVLPIELPFAHRINDLSVIPICGAFQLSGIRNTGICSLWCTNVRWPVTILFHRNDNLYAFRHRLLLPRHAIHGHRLHLDSATSFNSAANAKPSSKAIPP